MAKQAKTNADSYTTPANMSSLRISISAGLTAFHAACERGSLAVRLGQTDVEPAPATCITLEAIFGCPLDSEPTRGPSAKGWPPFEKFQPSGCESLL